MYVGKYETTIYVLRTRYNSLGNTRNDLHMWVGKYDKKVVKGNKNKENKKPTNLPVPLKV